MCEGLRGIENVIVSAEETNVEHEEGMIWGADITTGNDWYHGTAAG